MKNIRRNLYLLSLKTSLLKRSRDISPYSVSKQKPLDYPPWGTLVTILYQLNKFEAARLKKNIDLFLGPFFLKTDAAGRLFIQQKTDSGTFFFEIQTIFRILFKSGHKTW